MLENVEHNFVPVARQVIAAMQQAKDTCNAAVEALTALAETLHPLALLIGPLRYRKPYIKQPGAQFAIFAEGRLTQYKRLADGSIVKV
jgi:hypothetical protein